MEGRLTETLVLERQTQSRKCGKSILFFSRSKIWTLKKPKIIPKKLKSAFRVPDLNGMLQKCKGEESQGKGVGVGFS